MITVNCYGVRGKPVTSQERIKKIRIMKRTRDTIKEQRKMILEMVEASWELDKRLGGGILYAKTAPAFPVLTAEKE